MNRAILLQRLDITEQQLADFCRRWQITELGLFGSALRDDFGAGSDVDMLVTFAPSADWSLLDHIRMEQELSSLLGREAHLVSRRAIDRSENWIRREEILSSARVVYASR